MNIVNTTDGRAECFEVTHPDGRTQLIFGMDKWPSPNSKYNPLGKCVFEVRLKVKYNYHHWARYTFYDALDQKIHESTTVPMAVVCKLMEALHDGSFQLVDGFFVGQMHGVGHAGQYHWTPFYPKEN